MNITFLDRLFPLLDKSSGKNASVHIYSFAGKELNCLV